MPELPNWLPPLFEVPSYNQEILGGLYTKFKRDFVWSQPRLNGVVVRLADPHLIREKEGTFWHIISSGDSEETREIELERCRSISWIKPIIENCGSSGVLCWEILEGRKLKTKLFLYPGDYLVVLKRSPNCFKLITAFPIIYSSYREKVLRQYAKCTGNQKPPTR